MNMAISDGIIPGLTDDIATLCLARVPLIFHSKLKLVSKSWNALLSSSSLYFTCSNIANQSTSWFYLVLWNCIEYQSSKLFAVNLEHKICLLLPPHPTTVFVSPNYYTVFSGKLYFIQCENQNRLWACNHGIQCWEALPPPPPQARKPSVERLLAIQGKIHVFYEPRVIRGSCSVKEFCYTTLVEVYDPSTSMWTSMTASIEPHAMEDCPYPSAVLGNECYCSRPYSSLTLRDLDVKFPSFVDSRILTNVCVSHRPVVVQNMIFVNDGSAIRCRDVHGMWWFTLLAQGLRKHLGGCLRNASVHNVCGKLGVIVHRSLLNAKTKFVVLEVWRAPTRIRGKIVWTSSPIQETEEWHIHRIFSEDGFSEDAFFEKGFLLH